MVPLIRFMFFLINVFSKIKKKKLIKVQNDTVLVS